MLVTETVTERNCKRSIYTTWCENVIDITRLISFWLSLHRRCGGSISWDRPAGQGLNRLGLQEMDPEPMELKVSRLRGAQRRRGPGIGCAPITSLGGVMLPPVSVSVSLSLFNFSPPTVRTVRLETPCLNYKEPF